ncbi:MAG: hypothetical protein ACK4P8_03235 [Tabrizicola sp.]
MRHDWIFDVLSDLQDYAWQNDLPDLAMKVEEALAVALREVEVAPEPPALTLYLPRRAH